MPALRPSQTDPSASPEKPAGEAWLTAAELAGYWQMRKGTVNDWVRKGLIPARFIKVCGRRRRLFSSETVAHLESLFAAGKKRTTIAQDDLGRIKPADSANRGCNRLHWSHSGAVANRQTLEKQPADVGLPASLSSEARSS
jgi:hypothetical protein